MGKNDNALVPQGHKEGNFFQSGSKLINPVRAGLNVALTINQRFMGNGAPVSSFDNPVIDDLQSDVFWYLYLWECKMLPVSPEGREANRMLLDWLTKDPGFQQARGQYINHQISAAATAYEMTKQLLDSMKDVANALQGLGQAEKMEDKADDLDEDADEQEGNGQPDDQDNDWNDDEQDEDESGSSDDGDEGEDNDTDSDGDNDGSGDEDEEQDDRSTPDEKRDEAQNLRDKAEQKREKAQKQLEQALGSDFSSMLRANAVNQGNEFGQEVQDFLSSWGFEEGQGVELSIEEIRRLMDLLGERHIAQLTASVGRVRDVALNVLRGRSQMQVVVDSIGYTQDVSDMFIDQQALLSTAIEDAIIASGITDIDPAKVREYYIAQMFENGGMLGYTRTSEARSEGTFIAAVDESGSMNAYMDGGDGPSARNIVAKALALGLARAAKMNGQEFFMFGFADSINTITNLVTDRSNPSELLEWGVTNSNGGTDFNVALNVSMDVFDNLDEREKLSADILLITDGESEANDATFLRVRDAKERYGMRLHLLLIGTSNYGSLDDVADVTLTFDNLLNIADVLAASFWLN